MKQRLLSGLLAVVLLLGLAPAALAAAPSEDEAAQVLAALDIMVGDQNGDLALDRTLTRAEFTTIAMGFAYKMNEGEASFPDVSENDWFYPYVMSAAQYGWIGGYGDGTFRPYNTAGS